jgi:MtN3 and saliva related transmembrane protein
MTTATIIGLLAGMLTTASFVPQIIKIAQTRQTRDLSLSAYVVLSLGVLLWVVYGVLINQVAIIVPNTLVFFMGIYIVIMKLRHQ